MTNVTRDILIGKLLAFELNEFGDSLPKKKFAFKVIVFRKYKQRYDPNEVSSRYVSKYEEELRQIEKK
jgi:hypothetical protein